MLGFFGMAATASAQAVGAVASSKDLAARYQTWGEEVLDKIESDYLIKSRRLYASRSADTAQARRDQGRELAMAWACGVQLSALGEGAALNPGKYQRPLNAFITALDVYIQPDKLGGYDVWPCPKPKDRYYDDNAWIVLGLIKAYEITNRRAFLTRAEAAMRFVLSGEDKKDGGIFWRETEHGSKHACSTGPTIVAALELHRIHKKLSSRKNDYLDTALRLHKWMHDTLRDTDGLYWDHIRVDGHAHKDKVSYNSGLMIRAECLLYEETGDEKYLREAQRIARASLRQWMREGGRTDDVGRFSHLLIGGLLELHKIDNDPAWLQTAGALCEYLHAKVRDENGLYPNGWGAPTTTPLSKVDLLDQASAAHLYLETARAYKESRPAKTAPAVRKTVY